MSEFEAKLSPSQVTAGKQRRAELKGRIAAKLATKEAPDARK
jgi:hypothetical protein